jgi:hypothetical protein
MDHPRLDESSLCFDPWRGSARPCAGAEESIMPLLPMLQTKPYMQKMIMAGLGSVLHEKLAENAENRKEY